MIHHYTSINTLALILETKKIRFTRLDCFDDMLEAKSIQGIDFGNRLFASCWTKAEESIPQWYMYGTQLSGVRLSFPPDDLFTWHELKGGRKVEKNGREIGLNIIEPLDAPYSLEDIYGYGYSLVPEINMRKNFLRDIEYVDNLEETLEELKKKITGDNEIKNIEGNFSDFGFHKSSVWSFQNECRFILNVVKFLPDLKVSDDEFINFYERRGHLEPLEIRNIDLPYNPNVLDSLLVTLGPSATKADEIIVRSLLEKYAPHSRLEFSSLSGKIRNVYR
ncbi:TPA: DUF2971 domain-containing protein [Acinetobacter baumannii]|nr:DUF2971 domain-containing protein [Acinetobacter baumannii]HCQ9888808.1 DUF2971 domain-containing protein [Acinetobacter baumannii]